MISKKFAKHLPHYFSLIGVLAAGAFGMVVFSYNPMIESGIVMATATAYVLWAIIHHLIHNDLTVGVVAEYFAIALVGVVVLLSLIYWS